MKNIQLEELPKSKEFMKQAEIADGLTKETGLEHGFRFCKPNDEIIIDKICVGDKCEIELTQQTCTQYDNFFHTHPKGKKSELNIADTFTSIFNSFYSDKNNISCVKAVKDKEILCEKIYEPGYPAYNRANKIWHIFTESKEADKQEHDIALSIMKEKIKYKNIRFDSKTGKIIKD